ncbi:hypothetical protein EW146_g8509 [Bondarzewia mesenterica]|uniref:Deoxyribonuclease NucA/NucB domain-containing protein n=1 Tax=Bondarzewia mesenterica TaxID=1095465 RepID=A0A4S4LDT8_9AGAM|nr:hypothetical protein EW146_g8509 [Bondarzewia mesenterica]
MLTLSAVLISLSLTPVFVSSQNFGLSCALYPDVCDTTCFAMFCGGVTGHALHYDPNSGTTMPNPSSQTTTANYRRAAIGCVNSNHCATNTTGLSCDEFPYASTYDGGLGGNFNPPSAYYQARSAPDSNFCPARSRRIDNELPKLGQANVTTVTTDDGTKWTALVGAELFKAGNTIWTEDKNATDAAKSSGAIDEAASTVIGKMAKIVSVN